MTGHDSILAIFSDVSRSMSAERVAFVRVSWAVSGKPLKSSLADTSSSRAVEMLREIGEIFQHVWLKGENLRIRWFSPPSRISFLLDVDRTFDV